MLRLVPSHIRELAPARRDTDPRAEAVRKFVIEPGGSRLLWADTLRDVAAIARRLRETGLASANLYQVHPAPNEPGAYAGETTAATGRAILCDGTIWPAAGDVQAMEGSQLMQANEARTTQITDAQAEHLRNAGRELVEAAREAGGDGEHLRETIAMCGDIDHVQAAALAVGVVLPSGYVEDPSGAWGAVFEGIAEALDDHNGE